MKEAATSLITVLVLLFINLGVLAQPTNCYLQLDEASGFDVSPYQTELNLAACDLVAAFPDSVENQFKIFSFGFYMNLEFYDEYSYPQAFEDMSAAVAQQSPYYLLIGRQSDHSGVFTRFWVDLKLPGTGIFSCATEEQLEALKARLLVAIEYDYFKNGKLAPEYDQAEMKGMEALKEHVLSLYECCDPQNRGVGTCDDCLSFESFKEILLHYGYEQVSVNNLIATPKNANDGIFNERAEVYFTENDSIKNLNSLMREYLDSLNELFEPIKADILLYNSLSCINVINEINKPLSNELAKMANSIFKCNRVSPVIN